MHRKSRVSSAISVCDNLKKNVITSFSTVAVAQWVRRWSNGHRVVQAKGSSPGGVYTNLTVYFWHNWMKDNVTGTSQRIRVTMLGFQLRNLQIPLLDFQEILYGSWSTHKTVGTIE